jgi:hypothetical protein
MKKILLGTLGAVCLLSTTAPSLAASAANPASTVSVKRLAFNGLHENALSANGWRLNGLGINGFRKNGLSANGIRKNGLPNIATARTRALHLQSLAAASLTR